ncbi:MAG: hypothetical protein ABR543_03655 [Gemmatimonadaceae bacterium]
MRIAILVARHATIAVLTCLAAHLSAFSAAAAQLPRPRTSVKAAPPPPTKALPPSTATPAAASSAVRAAFLTSLAQPAVSAAAKAEIQRQLRANRPMAFISGTWVTLVDLGLVYGNPSVRAALSASLGQSGPTLVDAAILDPARILLVFTPQQLGQLMMGDLAKEITASMNPGALQGNVTDNAVIGVLFVFGVGVVTGAILTEFLHHYTASEDAPEPATPPYDPMADPDGDGEANETDIDDDGDRYFDDTNGVPNDGEDDYPDDPNRHICDCGRPGIYFGKAITTEMANALHASLGAARAQLRTAVSLGAVQAGQTATIGIVAP